MRSLQFCFRIPLEWAHKYFSTSVRALIYFLQDTTDPWMTIKAKIHPVSQSLGLLYVDDVTIDFADVTNALRDARIVDALARQAISNSLKIDFIHGVRMNGLFSSVGRSPFYTNAIDTVNRSLRLQIPIDSIECDDKKKEFAWNIHSQVIMLV